MVGDSDQERKKNLKTLRALNKIEQSDYGKIPIIGKPRFKHLVDWISDNYVKNKQKILIRIDSQRKIKGSKKDMSQLRTSLP